MAETETKRVTALGFFDGLHRGHQAVIQQAVQKAAASDAKPCIVTFDRRPKNAVHGESAALLIDRRTKNVLAGMLFPGVELVELTFDHAMQTTPPERFAQETLIERLHAACAVCGRNYRFGAGGAGTPSSLKRFLPTETVPDVLVDGEPVSSTRIRACIESGAVAEANRMLGHPHIIAGQAVHGDGRGGKLGYATLNLALPAEIVRPRPGVYVSEVLLRGRTYRSITNFGTRPTFYENGVYDCETHLFGYTGETYGEEAVLLLYEFLRPERRFPDADALVRQIASDVAAAQNYSIPEQRKGENL